jgi:peptidoglycan/LPS O-acetylase OafA/YrhL
LDLLRSVAVLVVFFTHYFDLQYGLGATWTFLWHLGQLGVLIFFVHTSLVLMWSLERSSLQRGKLIAPFFLRRAFRIYPLSIVCVLFAYCFDARWSPMHFWPNLTLTQYLFVKDPPGVPPTITPLWSLPLEMEMYLALPTLFLIFRNRSLKLLTVVWGAVVALAFLQPHLGEKFAIFRFAPCFFGGVIAWRWIRDGEHRRFPGWSWPLAIAACSLPWMLSNEKYLPAFIALLGLSLGLAIPLFHEIRSEKLKFASKIIARYSYGIYLSHFPIMAYVMHGQRSDHPWFKVLPPMPAIHHYARPINVCLILPLTAIVSLFLYHAIEEPGIRFGRSLAQWLSNPIRSRHVAVASE